MLANATPNVTTHSAANTRYGVVSISLGALREPSPADDADEQQRGHLERRERCGEPAGFEQQGPGEGAERGERPVLWAVDRDRVERRAALGGALLDLVEDVREPVGDLLLADDLVGVVVGGVEVAERDLGDDDEADAGDGEQQERADLAAASFVGAAVGAAHRVERDAGDEGDQDGAGPDGGEVRPHVGGTDEPDGEQHEPAHGTAAAGEHERRRRRRPAPRQSPTKASLPMLDPQ